MNELKAGCVKSRAQVRWSAEVRCLTKPFRLLKQTLCGVIFNHRPLHPTDRGMMIGGKLCDRWCARCGKMVTMPMAEDTHYDA